MTNNNDASIDNNVKSWSNTGKNKIEVRDQIENEDPEIISGDAYAEVYAEVSGNDNSTELDVMQGKVTVENNNNATINNEVSAGANSGKNKIELRGSRAQTSIRTGDADSYASAVTMLNSNVTRITQSED